ncbi:MAG: hypothetical protein Q9173_003396 [Seirophora scorigena]
MAEGEHMTAEKVLKILENLAAMDSIADQEIWNGKKTPHFVFHEMIGSLGSLQESCLLLHEKRKKNPTTEGFTSVVTHLEIILSTFPARIVEAIHTKNKYSMDIYDWVEAGRLKLLCDIRRSEGGQLP